MNYMRTRAHSEQDPNIPQGKAILELDNNGFVGTNNGWPLVGQPALFPESQARAIALAWNFCVGKVVVDPPEELMNIMGDRIVPINAHTDMDIDPVVQWLNGNNSGSHVK